MKFRRFDLAGQPAGQGFTVFSAQGLEQPAFSNLLFDGSQFFAVATMFTGDFSSTSVFGALVRSSTAMLPPLQQRITGNNVELTWDGIFCFQKSDALVLWQDLSSATSPHLVPINGTSKFWRLTTVE
jgi:hypothetical protein